MSAPQRFSPLLALSLILAGSSLLCRPASSQVDTSKPESQNLSLMVEIENHLRKGDLWAAKKTLDWFKVVNTPKGTGESLQRSPALEAEIKKYAELIYRMASDNSGGPPDPQLVQVMTIDYLEYLRKNPAKTPIVQPGDPVRTPKPSDLPPFDKELEEKKKRMEEEYDRRDFNKVVKETQALIQEGRSDAKVYELDSRAKLGLGDANGALASATKAVELDPSRADGWATRSASLLQLGERQKAKADAEKALALDPRHEPARAVKYLAREVPSKDLAAADAQAQRIQELLRRQSASARPQPLPPEHSAGAPAQAVREGGMPATQRAEAFYRDAATQIKLGDYKAAAASAGSVIRLFPNSAEPYALRAAAYNYLEDYGRAIEDASAALRMKPGSVAALTARAWALNQLGRYAEALADAKAALRLDPRNAYALLNRAMAEQGLGLWDDMIANYAAAAGLNPAYAPKFDAAIASFEQATGRSSPYRSASAASSSLIQSLRGSRGFWAVLAGGAAMTGALLLILLGGGERTTAWLRRRTAAATPGAGGIGLGPNYDIVRELGRGGMGIVYEAKDIVLGRRVAIKKMKDDLRSQPKDRERFLREARMVAAMKHPNIVDIHSVFELDGEVFLVFEFVSGITMGELIGRRGRLPPADALALLRPVCDALAYAHERRIIHRDLKPANIMVGDDGVVKVMDFGLARQIRETPSKLSSTEVIGTPAYMAPEQERGEPQKASDIYALGGCLYEMLTGDIPFKGPHLMVQKLDQAFADPSEIVPGLPTAVDAVIRKALAPEPERRYASGPEFLAALEAALTGAVPPPVA